MADTITLTSTTNTEAEVRSALGLAVEAPAETPVEPVEAVAVDPDAVEEAEAEVVAEPVAAQQQAAGKKRGRLQSRIDELVAERDRMRGLTATQQTELDAYRLRVSDLVSGRGAAVAKVDAPVAAKTTEAVEKPRVDQFATYEEYTEAVALWATKTNEKDIEAIVEARLKKERDQFTQHQQQLSKNEQQRRYAAEEVKAREKYEDYTDVINAPDLKASDLMVDQMLKTALGPEIAYYLGKHPEQCQKLFEMGNTADALKQFGKIEARVESALEAAAAPTAADSGAGRKAAAVVAQPAGKSAAKPVVPAVTKAPDPITPVGVSAQGNATVDPSQMSYQEYRTWRNAQDAKRLGLR